MRNVEVTLEMFHKSLHKRSVKEIRLLAEADGYQLPAIQDKDALIEALFEARKKGRPETPAEGSEAAAELASPLRPEPAAGPQIQVMYVGKSESYHRAKCKFPRNRWVGFHPAELTGDQWAVIRADRQLRVKP